MTAVSICRSRGTAWKMPLDKGELRRVLRSMLSLLAAGVDRLDLLITDDRGIALYTRRHLGCNGPTNILSFPSAVRSAPACLVLSAETLLRECLLYGRQPREYAVRLLAHGLAHIAGHSHGEAMAHLEEKAVSAALAVLG